MKKIIAIVVLALLTGCGVQPLKTGKVDPGMSDLQVKAQAVVNEGYRLLAAVDREIGQAAADRIWTSAEAQKYLDQSIGYRKQLDGYAKLIGTDAAAALSQANITNAIVDEFLKAVIAKAAAARKAKSASWQEPIFLSA